MEQRARIQIVKIAFDHQVFVLQQYGGISRYICNLAEHLSALPETNTQIFAPFHFNQHLNATKNLNCSGRILPQLPSKLTRVAMETSKYCSRRAMKKFSPDIIHETYFTTQDFKTTGAKRILTVYDMIHERYADMFDQAHKTSAPKKTASLRADHVICISENTRKDLIEFCGVPEERTSVVYLSADKIFSQLKDERLEKKNKPFLLYVGSRGGYKNFNKFVKAFASSNQLKQNFDIRCFGGGPFSKAEMEMMVDAGLSEMQIHYHSGEDQELAELYQQAEAFIYPSLYEGFGIPPLEAMAAGCPVLSSNTSSLPEVVGNAGVYFDPTEQDDIQSSLEKVIGNETCKRDLVEKGFEQHKKFSWEKCTRETMNIYKGVS